MSGKYATPLRLEPAVSGRLRAWLVLVHCLAIALLPFTALPWWSIPAVLVCLLYSLWRSLRRYVSRQHPAAVCALEWFDATACRLRLGSGKRIEADLLPQIFMLSWLVIMCFRGARGRRYFLLLLPDMLERETFRRLRVRLMITRPQTAA